MAIWGSQRISRKRCLQVRGEKQAGRPLQRKKIESVIFPNAEVLIERRPWRLDTWL